MASRFTALIDLTTGQARAGAIEVTDPLTVTLHLSRPDISLVASMADYPAAIVPQSYAGGDPFADGVGTGPFRPVSLEVGARCVLERHPEHRWWGTEIFGGPWLDRVEFVDLGTNPTGWLAAAEGRRDRPALRQRRRLHPGDGRARLDRDPCRECGDHRLSRGADRAHDRHQPLCRPLRAPRARARRGQRGLSRTGPCGARPRRRQ